VEHAFDKLGSVLTAHMRQFLDQLPRIISTKPQGARRVEVAERGQNVVARALDATLHLRQAHITYHSTSSDRTKTYLVHPYRLAYAEGGLYLLAYVPEYGQTRTFAIERIQDFSPLDERFEPTEELPDTAFPHSLGVHSGPPERIEIEFQSAIADYVRSREWHASQVLAEIAWGVHMTLDVCVDRALLSWILSFGPFARVIAPDHLRSTIAEQLEQARALYHPADPA
jgi:predicted DNA-binding transcriptional regulator YafY